MPFEPEPQASDSLAVALSAVAEFTGAVALIQAAVSEIETKKIAVIGDIEAMRDTALADLQAKQTQAVAVIQLEKSGAFQSIQTILAALPNIAQIVQNAVNTLFGKDKGY